MATAPALAAAWWLLCAMGPYRPATAGSASLGMADAQVASGTAGSALASNPAGMSQVQHGVIEGGFARSGQAGSGAPYVSYVDSTSAWGIAAGIGYAGELGWTTAAPQRHGHDLRMGISAGGQSDTARLLIGASARYLSTAYGGRSVSGWTGDLGATVGLQSFRLGAVVRNGLALDAREAPRRIAVGAAVVGTSLVAELGGSWGVANGEAVHVQDATGQSYRGGLAWQLGQEGLQLRGGYHFDQIVRGDPTRHWVCAGLSWRTTQFAFDLGGAVDAVGAHDLVMSASISLLVPYDVAD